MVYRMLSVEYNINTSKPKSVGAIFYAKNCIVISQVHTVILQLERRQNRVMRLRWIFSSKNIGWCWRDSF